MTSFGARELRIPSQYVSLQILVAHTQAHLRWESWQLTVALLQYRCWYQLAAEITVEEMPCSFCRI